MIFSFLRVPLFLLLLFGSVCNYTKASHIIGGYITYKYISPNTFLLRYTMPYECSAAGPGTTMSLCMGDIANGIQTNISLPFISIYERDYNVCTWSYLPDCLGGIALKFKEAVFEDTIILPFASATWFFSVTDCCMPAYIDNLQNAGGCGNFIYTTLDNLNNPTNSSPQFNNSIYSNYCINQLSMIDFTTTDIDGDSVVYEYAGSYSGGACGGQATLNPYSNNYDSVQTLMSASVQIFDPSGFFFCNTSLQQNISFCFRVKEYRNGSIISCIKRDDILAFTAPALYPHYVSGNVFFDANNNSAFDLGEAGIKNKIIRADTVAMYAVTLNNGAYYLKLPPGLHHVTVPGIDTIFSNPDYYDYSFTSSPLNISNQDFAIYRPPGINNLTVQLMGFPSLVAGHANTLQVVCNNNGSTTIANAVVEVALNNALTFLYSIPLNDSVISNHVFFNIDSLQPFQTVSFNLYTLASTMLNIGDTLISTGIISPIVTDSFPDDNIYNLVQVVSASYDPNLKTVIPNGDISPQFCSAGNWLHYTIRFQNTGTSMAYNVAVHDFISHNLDVGTIDFISASHNCFVDVSNLNTYRMINFVFNNINLEDSGHNEPLSTGYVSFRIKPMDYLVAGDSIANSASIYFDNNPPVATNTVVTHITLAASIENNLAVFNSNLFPNPVSDIAFIKLGEKLYSVKLSVYDLTGRLMLQQQFVNDDVLKINAASLQNGIYFYCITTDKIIAKNKFVVQH